MRDDSALAIPMQPAYNEEAFAVIERRPRYFWTSREVRVLHEHYPSGGAPACKPLLPNRTIGGIHQRARIEGLRAPNRPPGRQTWTTTDAIDEMIRRFYRRGLKRGDVPRLSAMAGRPKWWVKKRAGELGLAVQRTAPTQWSAEELALLEENHHKNPTAIRSMFARRGFNRSTTAIVVKMKRMGLSGVDEDYFTARGLADVMGVESHTVLRWIEKYGLKAKRVGPRGEPDKNGLRWWIRRQDVRRFVIENAALIDLRKVVDKEWFIELLAGKF